MNKRVINLIIVDESGSMSIIEKQALAGINETLNTVRIMQKTHKDIEQRVTLITFDSGHKRVIYDNAEAAETKKLTSHDYNPCGATPLYDTIGLGISKINAIAAEEDNVLVTIITDGEENCSEEYSLEMVKNLIGKLKKHKWTFTFIGTDNLDVSNIANAMAIDHHLVFKEDVVGTTRMFENENRCRMRYNRRLAEGCPDATKDYFGE